MYNFSFIDHGKRDFLRDEDGRVVIIKFNSYTEAHDHIHTGELNQYGWTNSGTRVWCWEEEDGSEDVPA